MMDWPKPPCGFAAAIEVTPPVTLEPGEFIRKGKDGRFVKARLGDPGPYYLVPADAVADDAGTLLTADPDFWIKYWPAEAPA